MRNNQSPEIRVVVAAGGKSRLFPALSVALELRRRFERIYLVVPGKGSPHEREVCEKYRISLLKSEPISDASKNGKISSFFSTLHEFYNFVRLFGKERPGAVVAFGSEECLPVLAAASIRSIPYFLYEYNSVLSHAGALFCHGARHVFLGLPLVGHHELSGYTEWTGVPVKPVLKNYSSQHYPSGFEKGRPTVLISCGCEENDHVNMNEQLISVVKDWLKDGVQILWQTGKTDYNWIRDEMKSFNSCFIQSECRDFYPYYAVSKFVICKPMPWMLSEIAYFGLPCILLASSHKDHQHWVNAGLVEMQGWGIRVDSRNADRKIDESTRKFLRDNSLVEIMSQKALDNSPANALAKITETIVEELTKIY